jgi:hypothetical protein
MAARIRTIKPEALQHRKVGKLTDRQFRLWLTALTQADDEGREVADAEQLRALGFGYHPDVKAKDIEQALRHLDAQGLVHLYTVNRVRYLEFPSWRDHQSLDHPRASQLPASRAFVERSTKPRESSSKSRETSTKAREHSRGLAWDRNETKRNETGSNRNETEPKRKGREPEGRENQRSAQISTGVDNSSTPGGSPPGPPDHKFSTPRTEHRGPDTFEALVARWRVEHPEDAGLTDRELERRFQP